MGFGLQIVSQVEEFKKSLCMPPNKMREIEQSTRDQSKSPLWHSVQKESGHAGLYCCRSGFVKYSFLGVSPDGVVHDPSLSNPLG